jgi:hypothetical protein
MRVRGRQFPAMRCASRWKTALGIGLMVGVALAAGFADDETPRVVLPKMDVNAPAEKKRATPWRYARVGEWEVLSEVADTKSRSLLTGLRKFDHALRIIQPRLVGGAAAPLALLLAGESEYQAIAGPAAAGQSREFGALRQIGGRPSIVVNTDAEFDMIESDIGANTVDVYRQLDRQYLQYAFAAHQAQLPAWIEEGLAQTLADVEFGGAWVAYGKVETEKNMPSGEQPPPVEIEDFLAATPALAGLSFKQVFAHRSFMPLGEFFVARRADGSAPSPDSAWAKQAYALVHFCLFGNKLRYQQPLATLATRLKTEPMSETLFKECFGISYAKMEKELRGYLHHTRLKYQRYPLKPEQRLKPEPIDFREATEAEIVRLTGIKR